jgi:hypothetical protein
MAGVTDAYLETGDPAYRAAAESQWADLTARKAYITGGVGGRHVGESIGEAYELPNERAYAETCAAIASIFWNWRMLHIDGDARYTDWLERTLYNGFLAGVSPSGAEYFYENPLAASGLGEDDPWYRWAQRPPHRRQEWHDCTCCPPNVQRLLASLPGYFYSTGADGLWVHLFAAGTLRWQLPDGTPVTLTQETDYPWSGQVALSVSPQAERAFTLYVRVPGWAEKASVAVDGLPAADAAPGRYLALERAWRPGSVVEIELEMPAQRMVSDDRVAGNRGSVALQRGPLVYCLEGVDHDGLDVRELRLPDDAPLTPRHLPDLLGGVTAIDSEGLRSTHHAPRPLYQLLHQRQPGEYVAAPLRFIPYYAWANRGPASMAVWVRRQPR